MRHLPVLCLCLALAACGGDFSNDDLEFLNALPRREDLAAKLPQKGQGRSGGGLTTRAAGLVVRLGETSELMGDTEETGRAFNAGVDALLSLLEDIRSLPPTTREPDRREWGPYRAPNHPGFDVRFVMTREASSFDYRLEYRRTGGGEAGWWAFLSGTFEADAGIRKGVGSLHLDVERSEQEGLPASDLRTLRRLGIQYQTKALPTRVELTFTPRDGAFPVSRYTYREAQGSLGEMHFLLPGQDLVPGGLLEDLSLTTRWAPDGRGMAVLDVVSGDIRGAKYTECWDAQGRVTFTARSWDFFNPTEGERSTCPDFSALDG
ncbi:hypothetical protein [Comamonas sp. JC664]|uniref:hypothetical protein n=1 Tax=Comamonas sp. JC664 TaxID=2801917 RepID=UPI00191D9CB4|nr:hypothetical protein [Comamonas sp. JC664]MBL0697131.1 hypothetical protein [Comamonas sp. JC664]GHG82687.1 hypothetical protein GCM10012319_36990 [Comamonas sp. KCTC 72670]